VQALLPSPASRARLNVVNKRESNPWPPS
jgi:hypothetical protein